jgi:hypothetical protein
MNSGPLLKKQKNLSQEERDEGIFGDIWTNASIDPKTKVVPALISGEKNLENAISLVQQVKNRSNGTIPFFTSDERSDFTTALLEVYGEEVVQKYSGRGRPPKPIKIPPSELKYARVRKHRKKGRIVKVDTSVVFGTEDEVNKILKESSVSNHINTAYIERQNLNYRQSNARCQRKTQKFSKIQKMFILQLWIYLGYYHFVRPHWSLRKKNREGQQRWKQRTPLMAAGIIDHQWTIMEMLTYVVPKNKDKNQSINKLGT